MAAKVVVAENDGSKQVQQAQQQADAEAQQAAEAARHERERRMREAERRRQEAAQAAAKQAMADILPQSFDELARAFILAEVLVKPPPGLDDDW